MITTYEYDALNRLDVLTHYSPDETPENLTDNDKLAEYDYTVRADGRRTAVTEKYWESGTPYTTDIAWTYDNLGRLVEEDYDSHNNDLDYTTTFTYDLVGNRLSKVIDGVVDKTLTYEYDDNDRLLTSWKIIGEVDDGVNLETDDTTTTYGYTGTQQTSKTVEETYSTQTLSVVDYSYDLQGRMSEVVIDTYDSNSNIVKKETTTYVYDGRGIRVGSTYKVEEDTDQNPATALVVTKHEETSYLVDDMNPTGYAQVIEKIVREAGTATVTDAKVFTLGHDVIDQTTFTPGDSQAGSPITLLYDGHGSTRAVLDNTAAFLQHYAYTAYGLAIGFDEAQALTSLLYSGEAFDSRVGLQYLRARWYDPNSGRFNRLDPFSGNLSDPQSLHKYLYTHGDPISGIDPSGKSRTLAVVVTLSIVVVVGSFAFYHFEAAEGDKGSSLFDSIRFFKYESPIGKEEGEWPAAFYLQKVKPHRTPGDWQRLGSGCFAMCNIRLGTEGNDTSPWRKFVGNRDVFDGSRGFTDLQSAENLYQALVAKGEKPLLYAVQMQTAWKQPTALAGGDPNEIDMTTLNIQGGTFNFAALLHIRPGVSTWEDLPGSFEYQRENLNLPDGPVVHRTPLDPGKQNKGLPDAFGGPLTNYYVVAPKYDESVTQ
ncbi:tRNA3(Ser)-specific nuclease WapA precursor [Symmachiella dynata]|uniref:RHS repeat-associated core domain-containing protein n=1 Tax=Symmachiella dynata TaxID=2527995 RepID=UPI001189FBF4|nr:RHS repeat-associated core domain-containing protein [Symmachiella dynata]QDT46979.1 tRNA3(Ser)-specific nuclease WapA precursor [Symmachiella dynata]